MHLPAPSARLRRSRSSRLSCLLTPRLGNSGTWYQAPKISGAISTVTLVIAFSAGCAVSRDPDAAPLPFPEENFSPGSRPAPPGRPTDTTLPPPHRPFLWEIKTGTDILPLVTASREGYPCARCRTLP